MRLIIERSRLLIEPESVTDVAYIEEVLGLESDSSSVLLERVNAMGLSCLAYLEARPKSGEEAEEFPRKGRKK